MAFILPNAQVAMALHYAFVSSKFKLINSTASFASGLPIFPNDYSVASLISELGEDN